MNTTRNDILNFQKIRSQHLAIGNLFEVEIGDCNASDFVWCATESEARAAHAQLLPLWEEAWEQLGDMPDADNGEPYIQRNCIRKIEVDADGDEVGEEELL